mmetsp:Transcript_92322/g.275418  ORF Transcript_92322/g.275418 Transcript_92322/m.275418 type:complete len:234 (-) Transcript_92322:257-958(-)
MEVLVLPQQAGRQRLTTGGQLHGLHRTRQPITCLLCCHALKQDPECVEGHAKTEHVCGETVGGAKLWGRVQRTQRGLVQRWSTFSLHAFQVLRAGWQLRRQAKVTQTGRKPAPRTVRGQITHQKDVPGIDVAVQHAELVAVPQCAGELPRSGEPLHTGELHALDRVSAAVRIQVVPCLLISDQRVPEGAVAGLHHHKQSLVGEVGEDIPHHGTTALRAQAVEPHLMQHRRIDF